MSQELAKSTSSESDSNSNSHQEINSVFKTIKQGLHGSKFIECIDENDFKDLKLEQPVPPSKQNQHVSLTFLKMTSGKNSKMIQEN